MSFFKPETLNFERTNFEPNYINMKENIFELTTEQLKAIAKNLQTKIETGLEKDQTEIAGLPTYIAPKAGIENGKALVLDWGGTNFRAAIVEFFKDKSPEVTESVSIKLSATETKGFKQKEDLFAAMSGAIKTLKKLDKNIKNIGYCFSYPAESTLDGDAILLYWTKGIEIPDMVGKLVGKPFMNYLNDNIDNVNFEKIVVLNDTVACLFGGLSKSGYDTYLGLIVGTGTNMASLMQADKIKKLNTAYKGDTLPVNLESGNFRPPYLIDIDDVVDACSNNKGKQRFEKAISGMYLGEIFQTMFPYNEFEPKFDGGKLNAIVNYPDIYKEVYVDAARSIFARSAYLVAASLAGLVFVLKAHDPDLKKICLAAEGSLFWSKDKKGKDYVQMVIQELNLLLVEEGYSDVSVDICEVKDANLIGSAVAALS